MTPLIRHKKVFVINPQSSGIVIPRVTSNDADDLLRLVHVVSLSATTLNLPHEFDDPVDLWNDISVIPFKDGRKDLIFSTDKNILIPSAVRKLCEQLNPNIECSSMRYWIKTMQHADNIVIPPARVIF